MDSCFGGWESRGESERRPDHFHVSPGMEKEAEGHGSGDLGLPAARFAH